MNPARNLEALPTSMPSVSSHVLRVFRSEALYAAGPYTMLLVCVHSVTQHNKILKKNGANKKSSK